ncbi:ABC transporter permease [uncultured Marivirga sp.]|uniref:ABC transporter permease n=1 Tax=uncultured Marivirga sp. TaxID=1123707 RepID=UPI0030EB2249|tara:strand:+ start:548462 stop:550858 length:2397 start_codon:yes stop_codon:yes gene_type:complete
MKLHNLKFLIRRLQNDKFVNILNLFGLSIGIGASILILLFIQSELSYDRFHNNAENIYRIEKDVLAETGESQYWVTTTTNLFPYLIGNIPRLKTGTRVLQSPTEQTIRFGNKSFREEEIAIVDKTFFDVFSYKAVSGDLNQALIAPNTVVITENIAKKVFGDEDPIGQVMYCGRYGENKVTAVIKEMPENSHFHFDILISMETMIATEGDRFLNWSRNSVYTYVLAQGNINADDIATAIQTSMKPLLDAQTNNDSKISYQANLVTDIHLYSQSIRELEVNGDIVYIYMLVPLLFFIILIAASNYANLVIAHSTKRHKEISLKKIYGAEKGDIYGQLVGEATLISSIALIIGVFLVQLVLPKFNATIGKSLEFMDIFNNPYLVTGVILLPLIIGCIAGVYPAKVLSNLSPIVGIRSSLTNTGSSIPRVRRLLVLFQFCISSFLIIGSYIIMQQLNYVNSKDLGLDKENVLILPITQLEESNAKNNLKILSSKLPAVVNVSGATEVPGGEFMINGISRQGENDEMIREGVRIVWVDYNFINTLGLEIILGRDFSKEFSTDSTEAFIVNQELADKFGWENPIGKRIEYPRMKKSGFVIGVVKNFHYGSLKNKIEPVCLTITNYERFLSIKVKSDNMSQTLSDLENIWERVVGNKEPFSFFFLDDAYNKLYKTEIKLGFLINILTLVAIILASIGLFGLSMFLAENIKNEVSIRKVLGAGTTDIVRVFMNKFVRPVLLGYVISIPFAYIVFSRWLQSFSYQFNMGIFTFIVAGLFSITIAAFVVIGHSIKVSTVNPLNNIKN